MENNIIETREFQVSHYRKAGDKIYRLTDPRDIYEMIANQGARRMRACILALIPNDIQEDATEEVDKTLIKTFTGEKGKSRIKDMLDKFENLKVNQKMIEEKFKCKVNNLNADEMAELVKIYNALRDSIGKPQDYFEIGKTQSEAAKETEEKLKNRGKKEKSKSGQGELL